MYKSKAYALARERLNSGATMLRVSGKTVSFPACTSLEILKQIFRACKQSGDPIILIFESCRKKCGAPGPLSPSKNKKTAYM
jgi:hypothetical protein